MIQISKFDAEGVKLFSDFIFKVKDDYKITKPDLSKYTNTIFNGIQIDENKKFDSRLEIGQYLNDLFNLKGIERKQLCIKGMEDFWTWLSYIWFDQITNNQEYVKRSERYICTQSWNRYYVHIIAGAYYLYSVLGKERAKLFLNSPPHIISDFNDHLACYQYIVNYKNLLDVAIELYWNKNQNKPKTAATSSEKPGNVRRYSIFVSQLELTYDVYNMSKDKILYLLPQEFKEWKNSN